MTIGRQAFSSTGIREIGLERWEYDLWYVILRTALGGEHNRVMLQKLPGLDRPAVSRYLAANPNLLSWFKRYNRNIPYREQVKPFNFLLAFQGVPFHQTEAGRYGRIVEPGVAVTPGDVQPGAGRKQPPLEYPRVAAPYDTDLERAAENCFDRNTGKPVPLNHLKSYREVLGQYHMHPEAKFRNADYMDRGITTRRHVLVERVEYIGQGGE